MLFIIQQQFLEKLPKKFKLVFYRLLLAVFIMNVVARKHGITLSNATTMLAAQRVHNLQGCQYLIGK